MKKGLSFSVFIFYIIVFPVFSETADLGSVMNLRISQKELSQSSPEMLDEIIASDKFIIIEGSVASITEIERSENNLILDIHLINGEWIGLERVEVYKCIVNVNGIEWESRFPKRTPRELTRDLVLQNSHILVIGKVTDYVMENSKLVTVLEAEYIRNIQ